MLDGADTPNHVAKEINKKILVIRIRMVDCDDFAQVNRHAATLIADANLFVSKEFTHNMTNLFV